MDYLEQNLKHYNKHKKKIHTFASALGIKIVPKPYAEDGAFSAARRLVEIDSQLGEANTIAVLLHELGHAIQYYFGTEFNVRRVDEAYRTTEKTVTKSQRDLLVRYETEAWNCGECIASALNIDLGVWFFEIKRYYLNHYRTYGKK